MNPLISNINPLIMKMNMKKIFSWGMMLAAAFTLTNCAKEIDAPVQEPETVGYPFEIIASTVDTKTVNDGMSTKWVADDQINLFHAVGETTDYVNNNAFTVSDLAEGRFTGNLKEGEVLDPQEEYDWFAFYPYSSYIKTPANTSSGYMTVGSSATGVQVQKGNGSMSHIAGENYPLVGRAIAVPANSTPKMEMSHVSSLIAVNVKNTLEEPLVVESVSFNAPVEIVGTYYINFAGDITPESFTGSGEQYVSKAATLNVEEGTSIATDQSAVFYLAVKPFVAKANDKLVVTVNGYAKELTMTKDVTFSAGKIKTLNFAYDYVAPAGEQTVTFDFSEMGYSNGAAVDKVQESPISIAWNKGTNSSNAPKYYTTGEAIRAYGGNYFTISTTEGTIVKVEFTFATGEGTNTITADSGSYSNNAWIGDNQAIKFTIGGTSGHRRIATIKVTYKSSDVETPEQPVEKTLSAIEVVDPVVDYEIGDEFVAPTVKAVYSDNSTAIVTGATFDGYNMSEAGTQTVTVSYTEGTTVTETYDITVEAPVVDDTDYSGIYAIVAYRNSESKFYYLTNEETTSATKRLVAVVAGAECPTDGITLNASKLWRIAKSGNTYTLQSVESDQFVSWTSDNSATMDDAGLEFNISKNENGTYLLNNGERNLSLNNTTGSNYFAMYKGTMVDDLYLIEAVEGEEPAPVLTGISVSGQTTRFYVGDTFTFDGVVTATYSDETSKTVTATSVSSPDMSVAGTPNVTVTYTEEGVSVSAKYTINVSEEESKATVVLNEEFDNNSKSDSSTAITNTTFSNFSGATDKAYKSQYGGIKLGSSKAIGYITSKSLDLSSTFTVQIDACKYSSDTGNIVVTVGSQTQTIKNSELGAAGTFKTFTLTFEAATTSSTVKIATSSKRAYIDNVVITRN